jgi:hypothetical protein
MQTKISGKSKKQEPLMQPHERVEYWTQKALPVYGETHSSWTFSMRDGTYQAHVGGGISSRTIATVRCFPGGTSVAHAERMMRAYSVQGQHTGYCIGNYDPFVAARMLAWVLEEACHAGV